MRYTFQESKIWDGANDTVDELHGRVFTTKRRSLERARKALPKPRLGRTWILVRRG